MAAADGGCRGRGRGRGRPGVGSDEVGPAGHVGRTVYTFAHLFLSKAAN